jgi:hypothetical protein
MSEPAGDKPRFVLVVIRATTVERCAEALRAAVGLTLRGDTVHAIVPEVHSKDQTIARGIMTLLLLKQRVSIPAKTAELLRTADAVEVWT